MVPVVLRAPRARYDAAVMATVTARSRLRAGRLALWLAAALAVAACGGRRVGSDAAEAGGQDQTTRDMAQPDDATRDAPASDRAVPDAGPFCNVAPRAAIGGQDVAVLDVQSGGETQHSCCNDLGWVAVRLPEANGQRGYLMLTVLVFFGGSTPTPPLSVDLAQLPAGWGLKLERYICPATWTEPYPCSRAGGLVDSLDSSSGDTFSGTLQLGGSAVSDRYATVCLSASAGAGSHPQLSSAQLYVDKVDLSR